MMKGLRVKLTYTFSGVGVLAPPFISISGLTSEQLPLDTCPSGLLCLHITGLCVAGGGVTVGAGGKGYVLFVRNDNDGQYDKKRVCFYRDNVLLPFIDELRTIYDGWQRGMPITEGMKVVSWCDGDHAQIKSIIEATDEYNTYRISAMKHNAARTGTEQGADLTRVFRLMRQLHTKTTVSDQADDLNPQKRKLFNQTTFPIKFNSH